MKPKIPITVWCLFYDIWCFLNCWQCFVNGGLVEDLEALMDDDLIKKVKKLSIEEKKGLVEIDPDHLKSNPECGHIPKIPPKPNEKSCPVSRISNAAQSDRHYPWVIRVWRNSPPKVLFFECGGAIITQTTALTASHCVCGVTDIPVEFRQYHMCRGGDPYAPQPPNEVRDIIKDEDGNEYGNEITVGIGSSNESKLRRIKIERAYVMGTRGREERQPELDKGTKDIEDVALLMTTDSKGEGETFYDQNMPRTDWRIGRVNSLCLAAEKLMNTEESYEGKVVTVGWGDLYSHQKSKGNPKLEDFQHSCTANQFGPKKARFLASLIYLVHSLSL